MDLVVTTKTYPEQGETVIGESFFVNPGGKGANQAVAISKMGARVEMVGVVGQEFGRELISSLKDYKVSTKYVRKNKEISSGTAIIIVQNGDNRIILNPSANFDFKKADVDRALKSAKPGDILLTQIEIPIEIVEYALKKGKQLGMITFLNPAPAAKIADDVFQYIDYFLPNQIEAQLYTEIFPNDLSDAKKCAQKLLKKGVKNVLITLGDKGSYFLNANLEHHSLPYNVMTVDTTGAGDTYIGTFLTAIAEKRSIIEAMKIASLAASIMIQRLGAQKAIPHRKEIEKVLKEYEN